MTKAYATVRTIYCWIALALATVVTAIVYIPVALIGPESKTIRAAEQFWVWAILRGSNVKLIVHGEENLEMGVSYIVMANHRSMYDIPVLHYLLGRGRDVRWVGKRELVRVPVFGWAYGLSRHVAIDRQDRVSAIAALKRAAEESTDGVTFAIMPEGTRSVDRTLGRFKKGGFHLAIDTGLPILPTTIVGSEKLMWKGAWWILPGTIEVTFHPPIATTDYSKANLRSLVDTVREAIQSALTDAPADSQGGGNMHAHRTLGSTTFRDARLAIDAVFDGAADAAQIEQLVCDELYARFDHYAWVGIYRVEGDDLVLSAWAGPEETEHTRIAVGEGICGLAAATGKTEVVPDVSARDEFIACFPSTRSEIVVPIHGTDGVLGEIDIDSDGLDSFDDRDRAFLELLAERLAPRMPGA